MRSKPKFYKLIPAFCCLLLVVSLASCGLGGGGGGSEPEINIKGAEVSIDADPRTIGIGDRINVSVKISEVDQNGVIVKIRYDKNLRLVAESAYLTINGDETVAADPFEDSVGTDELRYAGYYFSRDSFDDDRSGELSFQLRAQTGPAEGDLEVDSDIRNPDKDPDDQFSARRSFFSAEDSISFEIEED